MPSAQLHESLDLEAHAVPLCEGKSPVDEAHGLFPIRWLGSAEQRASVLVADPGCHVVAADLRITREGQFEVMHGVLMTGRCRGGEAEERVVGAEAAGAG